MEVATRWKAHSYSGIVNAYESPTQFGVRYVSPSAEIDILYSLADHGGRTILTCIEEINPTTRLGTLASGKSSGTPRKVQAQELQTLKLLIEAPRDDRPMKSRKLSNP